MKLGIMQPYCFPYLGYFQLIHAVDRFVLYDDVAFIKQGWINRNFILVNGKAHRFVVPVSDISSNRVIADTMIAERPNGWREKLLSTFRQAYGRAPYYSRVMPLVESVFADRTIHTIGILAARSITAVTDYLGLETEIITTSRHYMNDDLSGQERILDICQKEKAAVYINASGGRSLYDKAAFSDKGINLFFIESTLDPYSQFKNEFVAGLSVLDIMMFNDRERILNMLSNYSYS